MTSASVPPPHRPGRLRSRAAGRAAALAVCAGGLLLGGAAPASAHVLVVPERVAPGAFTLFTVISPDEKTTPLTGLTLSIPPGLVVSAAQPAPGFRTQIVRDQTLRTIGLRWSGGRIPPGQMGVFQFTALPPSRDTTIAIPAVQTFADGSTQVWRSAAITVAAPASSGGGSSTIAVVALAVAAYAAAMATVAVALLLRLSRRWPA